MPSMRCFFRSLSVALALGASVAIMGSSAAPNPEIAIPRLRPVRLENRGDQIALSGSPAWREFTARHGRWTVLWNEATGTPHRAFGDGIRLQGFTDDPEGVDRAVRRFVAQNPSLLKGSPELETLASYRVGNLWYVRYRQVVRGIPVLFSDWEFRVGSHGHLIVFGADAHYPSPRVDSAPRIPGVVAREAAKAGLEFDPSTDRVEGGTDLYFLPYARGGRDEHRLVYDVRVATSRPRGSWINLVDASTGEVLWRHNRVVHATISGKFRTEIHPNLPTDNLVMRNQVNQFVSVGATLDTTDASGNYSAICTGSVSVSATFSGPYCLIKNLANPDNEEASRFSQGTNCPGTRSVDWRNSNSLVEERDAFYHANVAHDYVKRIDPPYTASDRVVVLSVNSVDDECTAYWDPSSSSIVFGEAGTTCPNAATVSDVVYHEYAHRVNDDLYFSRGSTFGLVNSVLHHGTADIMAAFMQDDPVIGQGFFGVGTQLRDLSSFMVYPEDASGGSSETGLILGGAFWDLRQSVGLSVAERLVHFAKYGLPDDPDDGVAMSEYFIETLLADDDDANLSNGTPHINQIKAAFAAHGIGTNFFLNVSHTPLGDQPFGGPYPITAVIQYTGPIGGLDPGSPTLHYQVNDIPFETVPMLPTGSPDQWSAEIPGQSAAIVRYYLSARDQDGGARTEPAGAPARDVHMFIAGPASSVLSYDMESDPQWVVGAPDDNATTGIWVRVDPIGTIAQPEDDHTPTGILCWVTGNGTRGGPEGENDVDGGKTTLTTASFDATAGGITLPMVSFYRWYSNAQGDSPGQDYWVVRISNNGGATWVTVDSTSHGKEEWVRELFFIDDYVTPTNNMKLRFIASDYGLPSLVEAAVDDFDLIGFTGPVAVGGPRPPRAFSLAPAAPNPFRSTTRLSYTLPVAGMASLSIYDIHGRHLRSLVSGVQGAGVHWVEWDGRDGSGRPVASGPYFLRLAQNGSQSTQAVVRIK